MLLIQNLLKLKQVRHKNTCWKVLLLFWMDRTWRVSGSWDFEDDVVRLLASAWQPGCWATLKLLLLRKWSASFSISMKGGCLSLIALDVDSCTCNWSLCWRIFWDWDDWGVVTGMLLGLAREVPDEAVERCAVMPGIRKFWLLVFEIFRVLRNACIFDWLDWSTPLRVLDCKFEFTRKTIFWFPEPEEILDARSLLAPGSDSLYI